MEIDKLYKGYLKALKEGKLKGLLLIAPDESECRQILMGDKLEVTSGLMIAMYQSKDFELLVKRCARLFDAYKKEMDKKFK